jgi:uncharacterized protein
MRRTIAGSLRRGGHLVDLARRRRRRREPPLVVIADISGSMSNYSRLFLHFVHALMSDRDRVHAIPVRHPAHQRHPRDRPARRRRGHGQGERRAVQDWSGGTRIGQCLKSSIIAGRAACWRKVRTCC